MRGESLELVHKRSGWMADIFLRRCRKRAKLLGCCSSCCFLILFPSLYFTVGLSSVSREPEPVHPPVTPPPPPPLGTQLSWKEAYERAAVTLAAMNESDKGLLLQGIGWENTSMPGRGYYVGNTAAVPLLGIPALKMQDAAGGFRTIWPELVGTVTVWPSLLSFAASFDQELVEVFGKALGAEFRGKGANGILGPSVNVHRVARGGRNFELLSGEDPHLGSVLVPAYVRGLHSQSIFTVAKHYILNNQETNRETYSAQVDDKTLQELYLPPFKSAVDAGIAAVMCAYNKVDGEFACSSSKHLCRLKRDLKFKGFVQSDWWATHETAIVAGLDQEMPGAPTSDFLAKRNLSKVSQDDVDESATRVVAAMHRFGLMGSNSCTPPGCYEQQLTDVTSDAHRQLARKAASESVVLLKNEEQLLPLEKTLGRLAVIGAAADASAFDPTAGGAWNRGDYYSGGGSGHVVTSPEHQVTVLDGVRRASSGSEITVSASDDVEAARQAAAGVDVAIVVLGAMTGEEEDRSSLDLDCAGCTEGQSVADLVGAVQEIAPTLVVVLAPGAVLLPFKDLAGVKAMVTLFLGGEQTGNAIADVVFGDVVPSGRLPLMLPASETDAIAPSSDAKISYSEGLATSYRGSFTAAYPFGYGLSYTWFEYADLVAEPCDLDDEAGYCISVTVTNSGAAAGRDVPQLYLEFPEEAGQPKPVLKGFHKTALLQSGESEKVTIVLSPRELSYYDIASGSWVLPHTWTVHLGASSEDTRLQECFGACPEMQVVV